MSNLERFTALDQSRRISQVRQKVRDEARSKDHTKRIARTVLFWERVNGCWIDEEYKEDEMLARGSLAVVLSVPDEAADKSGLFTGTLHGVTTDLLNETRFAFGTLVDAVVSRDERIRELEERCAKLSQRAREMERSRP